MAIDDKYTYPGSGGVLVNAAGIRDQDALDEAMNDVATAGLYAVQDEAIPEPPDLDYLRSIHVRMFRDLLPNLAGTIRDVDVQAGETGIPYCRPEFIDEQLSSLSRKLEREDYLTGLDADTFADRLADRWGELSAIHPYRDGNTRSQSSYVSAIAERAGHPIDWERIDVDALRAYRLQAVVGNDRPLAVYLRAHLLPSERGAAASGERTGPRIASRRAERDRRTLRGAGYDVDRPRSADHEDENRRREQQRRQEPPTRDEPRSRGGLER
jgi:cell filamentation protein